MPPRFTVSALAPDFSVVKTEPKPSNDPAVSDPASSVEFSVTTVAAFVLPLIVRLPPLKLTLCALANFVALLLR